LEEIIFISNIIIDSKGILNWVVGVEGKEFVFFGLWYSK
jgi:hypothetical protein